MVKKNIKIAVLLTCHNRVNQTLSCLTALYQNKLPCGCKLDVHLVDDGSEDGTGIKVKTTYPEINLIMGDGNLYWNGGMRLAFLYAMRQKYDYYLWLNDDTILYPDAMKIILKNSFSFPEKERIRTILVGSTLDPRSHRQSYGGLKKGGLFTPLNFKKIEPSDMLKRCDSMNGNCVLIPQYVASLVGNLSSEFTHSMGDIDYGLRATKKRIFCRLSTGYAGVCAQNAKPRWSRGDISLNKRWIEICSPKGVPPREWLIFTRRHAPFLWPLYMIRLYLRRLL